MSAIPPEIEEAARLFLAASGKKVLIISHYDADGLAAASILASTAKRLGCYFHIVIAEQLAPKFAEEAARLSHGYDLTIMSDMGSDAPGSAKDFKNLLVLDHHTPGATPPGMEVNPHKFGFDGARDISAAGLAYLLARRVLGDKAIGLAPLAIVGALGDRQDVGERFRLTGLNKSIVEEAAKHNIVAEAIGLRISGGLDRPLVKALALTSDPFIPGITGDEAAALNFLKRIGLEVVKDGKQRTLRDLGRDERRRLASELVKYLIGAGYSVGEAERLYGYRYIILAEPPDSLLRDAKDFAQVLNACGRMGYYGVGIAIGMGAREEVLRNALDIYGRYRVALSKALSLVKDSAREEGERVVVVDLRGKDFIDARMSGAIASLLVPIIGKGKIVIVAVDSVDGVKISARRGEGLDLHVGVILREAANSVGGVGGGHDSAGGALVPSPALGEFVSLISRMAAGDAGK